MNLELKDYISLLTGLLGIAAFIISIYNIKRARKLEQEVDSISLHTIRFDILRTIIEIKARYIKLRTSVIKMNFRAKAAKNTSDEKFHPELDLVVSSGNDEIKSINTIIKINDEMEKAGRGMLGQTNPTSESLEHFNMLQGNVNVQLSEIILLEARINESLCHSENILFAVQLANE